MTKAYCKIEVRFRNGEVIIKTFDNSIKADNFFCQYYDMIPDRNNPRTQVMIGYPRYIEGKRW